jgi:hypothetical protein
VVIRWGIVERKRRSRSPQGAATGGQRCDLDGKELKVTDLVGPLFPDFSEHVSRSHVAVDRFA